MAIPNRRSPGARAAAKVSKADHAGRLMVSENKQPDSNAQTTRKRELLAMTYAERKLAEELGFDPHVARLFNMQAYGHSHR